MLNKVLFLTVMLLTLISAPIAHCEELKAAIIIDDFGGGVGGVKEFLEGNVPITVAVMPFTEKSKEHAEWAHKNGFEVILHLPMQPKKGKISWLGPKPITVNLTPEEVKTRVHEAIKSVPHVSGLNNHMGSLVVEKEGIVRAIVEEAREHNLFIIDSATSPKSKFDAVAEELKVPLLKRDIFLDDVQSVAYVKTQMMQFADITKKKGKGIAIGHVGVTGRVCSTGILQSMEEFKELGIQIVPVSELIEEKMVEEYFKVQ